MERRRGGRTIWWMRVEQLMTRTVVTVAPETTLKRVAAILGEHRISGVPVVDAEGCVIGVVSRADIVRKELGSAGERDETRTAGDAMSTPAVTVPPRMQVADAARLMLERDVDRLPAVSDHKLVGIVTRSDLVRAFARTDREIEREIRNDVLSETLRLDPEAIAVSVRGGEVMLEGRTVTRTVSELVVAFVRRVPGVTSVVSPPMWELDDLAARPLAGPGEPLH